MSKTLVITPTFNEAENVERLITMVLEQAETVEMLIVDDNSPDGTAAMVKRMMETNPRIHIIERQGKMGLGTAYVAGFKYAIAHKYDYVMEMDADFSHNPKDIPAFLKAIERFDLVIGSRYCKGISVVYWPMKRLLLSYYANVYTRIITGLPLKDATGGFKCYRRETLESINLDKIKSNGYSFQIEMSFKIWCRGFRLTEIPIIFVDRDAGVSKMSRKIVYEAVYMVWVLKLRSLLGRL
ncbi:MAG TPA: polyprenol monophosphomannose synthase [Bacteroidota bacterium]|nr:polyprenol monophosphomannose synthase [Bacteroidota bacterium]